MATSQSGFEERASTDPYGFMSRDDMSHIADNFDIVTIDAVNHQERSAAMSWSEKHIGGGGLLTVTDYGRHRDEWETLDEFEQFIREEIRDSMPSQYLKVMDDEKEEVITTLVAISREDGYLVLPKPSE